MFTIRIILCRIFDSYSGSLYIYIFFFDYFELMQEAMCTSLTSHLVEVTRLFEGSANNKNGDWTGRNLWEVVNMGAADSSGELIEDLMISWSKFMSARTIQSLLWADGHEAFVQHVKDMREPTADDAEVFFEEDYDAKVSLRHLLCPPYDPAAASF